MCQGFSNFSVFLHHFVLSKLATTRVRAKSKGEAPSLPAPPAGLVPDQQLGEIPRSALSLLHPSYLLGLTRTLCIPGIPPLADPYTGCLAAVARSTLLTLHFHVEQFYSCTC